MEDVRRRVAVWWVGLTLLGVGIIAVPDSDEPLITLSGTHGPGVVDLIGIVIVLAGTAVLYRHLISTRKTIVQRLGRPLSIVLAVSWVVAVVAAIAAVALDRGMWWLVGVLDATAVHAVLLAMSAPPTDAA